MTYFNLTTREKEKRYKKITIFQVKPSFHNYSRRCFSARISQGKQSTRKTRSFCLLTCLYSINESFHQLFTSRLLAATSVFSLSGGGKRVHIVADTNLSPFARARNICCGHNVSDFSQKHLMSATNVSRFARHGLKTNVLFPARLPNQETS